MKRKMTRERNGPLDGWESEEEGRREGREEKGQLCPLSFGLSSLFDLELQKRR